MAYVSFIQYSASKHCPLFEELQNNSIEVLTKQIIIIKKGFAKKNENIIQLVQTFIYKPITRIDKKE